MSSIPIVLNSYDTMNSIFRDHQTKTVRSMFNTSEVVMNHHGLFSPPHAFDCYQDSNVFPPSFGLNNPHVAAYQMTQNMVTNVVDYFPINGYNPHFSQVSFTQTITKTYSATVPTSNMVTYQNEYERAMNPNFLNPPTFVHNQREILNPTPLNTINPQNASVYPRSLDLSSFPPNHHHDNNIPLGRPLKKRSNPTTVFEQTFDGFDFEEDGEYDGRMHSLSYKRNGPYICPKCTNVFDTSQKFAAHVSLAHYKNETAEEKAKRCYARNRKKLRKLLDEETHKIQWEDRVVDEAFQHRRVVKEEPIVVVLD